MKTNPFFINLDKKGKEIYEIPVVSKNKRRPIKYYINEKGCHICISHHKNTERLPKIRKEYKIISVKQYLWEKEKGSVPKGLELCHTCDNPECINLEHIWLGTHNDNMQDMKIKGRGKGPDHKGEKNPSSKLTEQQVLEIRKEKGTLTELGQKYGICFQAVSDIKRRKNWKHI